MGIDVDSALVVGLSYTKLPKEVKDRLSSSDDVYGLLKDAGLSHVPPWFDADIEECIIGVAVNISAAFGDKPFDNELKTCQDSFKEFSGVEGKLICSPDVW